MLGTFLSTIHFLDNYLNVLDFHGSMACRKAKLVAFILCNGDQFIGGIQLVGLLIVTNTCKVDLSRSKVISQGML